MDSPAPRSYLETADLDEEADPSLIESQRSEKKEQRLFCSVVQPKDTHSSEAASWTISGLAGKWTSYLDTLLLLLRRSNFALLQ